MRKVILQKFRFLTDRGFSFSEEGDESTYKVYCIESSGIRVSISYDYRREFVDLRIKRETEILLATSGNCVFVNAFSSGRVEFMSALKEIYARSRIGRSLSRLQMLQVIDLYADYVFSVLGDSALVKPLR